MRREETMPGRAEASGGRRVVGGLSGPGSRPVGSRGLGGGLPVHEGRLGGGSGPFGG